MKKTFVQNHPYWAAIIAAVICTFLSAVGAASAQIAEVSDIASYAFMTGSVVVSALLGLLYIRKSRFSMEQIGFRKPAAGTTGLVWLYLPLLALEIIPLIAYGPSAFNESFGLYAVLTLFTLFVGLNEELYFRGLVFTFLQQKGSRAAVIGSSIIFGALHAANVLSANNPWQHVLLQIVFAFLVGLVLALIMLITKSLWVGIVWHAIHNFLSFSTEVTIDGTALIVVGAQVLILLIYTVVLWKKARI